MTEQSTLNEYQAGKLEVLETLEQFIIREQERGRRYWSSEQIYGLIRSIRLNLQEKWK